MMYWRQILASVLTGAVVAIAGVQIGFEPFTAALVGLLVVLTVRWVLATIGRTRYWLHRGTRDFHRERCPNCDQRRHRLNHDWVLECHTCGWRAGWPGIRWLTRSVPARQARRSISLVGLAIALVTVTILMTGWQPPPDLLATVGGIGSTTTINNSETGTIDSAISTQQGISDTGPTTTKIDMGTNTVTRTETQTPTPTAAATDGLNTTKVEQLVVEFTNEERRERGLDTVAYAPEIATAAREHARDMARNDFVGHTGSDGESAQERYDDVCSYSGTGYVHGENVNAVFYDRRYTPWGTDDGVVTLRTEEDVARMLVKEWMHSEGHRKNMLQSGWTGIGVGVAINDEQKVFAAQAFCSV